MYTTRSKHQHFAPVCAPYTGSVTLLELVGDKNQTKASSNLYALKICRSLGGLSSVKYYFVTFFLVWNCMDLGINFPLPQTKDKQDLQRNVCGAFLLWPSTLNIAAYVKL